MPGFRKARTLGGVLAALTCLAPPVRAEAPGAAVEPIVLAYSTDGASCPTQDRFVAIVRRYTTKWRTIDTGDGLRRFQIELGRRDTVVAGKLAVTNADGTTTTREIVGPECAGVALALAVVVALALDPAQRTEDDESPPRGDPPPRSAPPPELPARPLPPDRGAPRIVRPPPREGTRLLFAAEARGEISSAVTSRAMILLGAAFEVRATFGDRLPRWASPSIAVGLRQSLPREIEVDGGSTEFLFTAATLRLCPVRFAALEDRFEASPCAESNLGVLFAEARGIPDARRTSNAWFDLGGSARAVFRLGRGWAAGASVLVSGAVTRNRFELVTGALVSQAPAVGVTGGLLAEHRF